jgi:ferredoxin
MAHVVTKNCFDCRYTDCVVVCPVECFYGDDKMLYIDADDCIDCEACVPECPVEAIYLDVNVPADLRDYIKTNRDRVADLKNNDGHLSEKQKPLKGDQCSNRNA